jgi:branched-chain amino acid transport system substrate-binding protein
MKKSMFTGSIPFKCLLLLTALCYSFSSCAQKIESIQADPVHIYLDADQTNSANAGAAIELGVRAALHEANNKLGGYPVELIVKDHHGSSPRSQYHLEQFSEDPKGLIVFGGMHSPPLLSSREYINDNEILTLIPWAAATPITRPKHNNNWIFRLSIDDSKAGKVIIENALRSFKSKSPFLLLEDSGWGRANKKTIQKTLDHHKIKMLGSFNFQWGIGHFKAREMIEEAVLKGADSLVLIANAAEGLSFVKANLAMPTEKQLPISSHWGITGGKFVSQLSADELAKLKLQFIQTDYSSFLNQTNKSAIEALLSAAKILGKEELKPNDIAAPAGFVHAYDLTKILIAACSQIKLSGNALSDRRLIKKQLENLSIPVDGIIKRYASPFSKYTLDNIDAHEALQSEDLLMAHYQLNGKIQLHTKATAKSEESINED